MSDNPFLVLLVEANAVRARQACTALAASTDPGCTVHHVDRLSDALGRLTSHCYDVILLSLSLPDTHDLDGFQRLRDESPGTPIVVLTADPQEVTALRAIRAGADDVILLESETSEAVTEAIGNVVERAHDRRRQQGREKQLDLLAQQLPCVFWTTDPQLRITSFDGGDAAGMDVQPAALLGQDVGALFPDHAADVPFRAAHRQALEGSSTSLDIERQGRMYHVHIEPFHGRDGRLIGAVGLAMDVTDRKLIDLELRLTRQIQAGMLPSTAPKLPGLDIAGASVPVAEAGGDYFDYFPLSDGSMGIVVCDVGGHGLGPALMMSHTRAYLRALAMTNDDPGQILTQVNRFLCEDIDEERLVTLFFAKLDAASLTFTYSNMGHQGYRLGADGKTEVTGETNGLPLNVLAETIATTTPPDVLTPGDLVVLYTDGIVENPTVDGEPFGTEQMLEVVQENRDRPAAHIVETILQAVHESPRNQIFDDMTLVVIKVE